MENQQEEHIARHEDSQEIEVIKNPQSFIVVEEAFLERALWDVEKAQDSLSEALKQGSINETQYAVSLQENEITCNFRANNYGIFFTY